MGGGVVLGGKGRRFELKVLRLRKFEPKVMASFLGLRV